MSSTAQHAPATASPWKRASRRWPTAAAIAFGVVSWGIDTVTAAHLLPLLPLVYLAMTVVRRRRFTWVVLAASLAGVAVLNLQSMLDPTVAVTLLAVVLALVSLVTAPEGGRTHTLVQSIAFAVLAVATVTGLATDPGPGRYLIAAGWLAHAGWDLVHHCRDQVVSRSYAEWCGVFDLLIATSLIAAPLIGG